MEKKTQSFLASCGMLVTAMIWGFAFVVVKDIVSVIPPVYMIAFRFTIAGAGLIIVFFNRLKKLTLSVFIHGCFIGVFLFLAYLVQTIGIQYTTAGKNAFLTTIYVILIPLIGWPLYKKRPHWHVFVAAGLSLTGIGLLALGGDDISGINIGDILTLLCGLFFALHILWTEKCNKEGCDTIIITMLQFAFAAFFGWILAPFMDGAFPIVAIQTPKVVLSMLYLGLFSSMICFSLQNIGLKYVQSSLASLFLSFESVFGVLFSTIFLHETLTLKMAVGCVLIFSAIVIAECLKKE